MGVVRPAASSLSCTLRSAPKKVFALEIRQFASVAPPHLF